MVKKRRKGSDVDSLLFCIASNLAAEGGRCRSERNVEEERREERSEEKHFLALEKGVGENQAKFVTLETCEGVDTMMLMHSLRGGGFDGESQC